MKREDLITYEDRWSWCKSRQESLSNSGVRNTSGLTMGIKEGSGVLGDSDSGRVLDHRVGPTERKRLAGC